MNTLAPPIAPLPSVVDLLREQVARLQPELRDRLARLLVGAGAGVVALIVRTLLAESPVAGLVTALITNFIVEPLLLEIIHNVLF